MHRNTIFIALWENLNLETWLWPASPTHGNFYTRKKKKKNPPQSKKWKFINHCPEFWLRSNPHFEDSNLSKFFSEHAPTPPSRTWNYQIGAHTIFLPFLCSRWPPPPPSPQDSGKQTAGATDQLSQDDNQSCLSHQRGLSSHVGPCHHDNTTASMLISHLIRILKYKNMLKKKTQNMEVYGCSPPPPLKKKKKLLNKWSCGCWQPFCPRREVNEKDWNLPVSYTHLTLPTKLIV